MVAIKFRNQNAQYIRRFVIVWLSSMCRPRPTGVSLRPIRMPREMFHKIDVRIVVVIQIRQDRRTIMQTQLIQKVNNGIRVNTGHDVLQ